MIFTAGKRQPKVDAELLRQLEEKAAGTGLVEAVFVLRPSKGSGKAASAEETEGIVKRLLQRVEDEVGVGPQDFNVFRNLGSFVVVAESRFVRELLTQDEIASATANRQPSNAMIQPSKRRSV